MQKTKTICKYLPEIIHRCFLFSFALLIFSGCQQQTEEKSKSAQAKPNIIYILADDLGYGDLSINGQAKFSTPNIDKLARQGMLFTQHYAGSTVCAPSRSALMTGQHTGHTFIRGNKAVKPEGQYPIEDSIVTLAELLQQAGYITGAFGKWGLGPPASEGDPIKQGFNNFYGYNCQSFAHNYYPYHLWNNDQKEILTENRDTLLGTYAPDLIQQQALNFLDDNKDTTFFLFYPSVIPHAELAAPENIIEKFRGKFPPEVPFEGSHREDLFKKGDYGPQNEPHAAFAAMVYLLDQHVGQIMKKVEELGIADNTIIIFTSDNGPHLEGGADPDYFNSNAGFRGYKRDLYEGGIRVPMIVNWPGKVAPGTTSDHVSAFWDVLPTFCDIAKMDTPTDIDGISFLPALTNGLQQKHNYLYWEFLEQGGKQAVRFEDWKAIKLNMGNDFNAPIELYNLATDKFEENNIAEQHPDIVEKAKVLMAAAHHPSEVFRFAFEVSE